MKLNLGCSYPEKRYRDGTWINFDLVRHKYVSVIGSGFQLPFKDNSFKVIHCIHVLEHLTRDKPIQMLKEIRRVIHPQGEAFIEVPNFEGVVNNLYNAFKVMDKRQIHIWTTSTYGKNERPGMAHHWGFYPELLGNNMLEAGFQEVIECEEMISGHYKQEPVILMRGKK